MRFRLRRAALAMALALGAGVIGATGASAHIFFVSSDPGDGAALKESPSEVRLVFNHAVIVPVSRVTLTDSHGQEHPIELTFDPADNRTLLVRVPPLPHDAYRFSYTVRDSLDLHETSGSIVIGVGTTPNLSSEAPVTRAPRPGEVAARWVAEGGFAIVLGGLAVALLVIPAAANARTQRTVLLVCLAGLAVAAAGESALLLVQTLGQGQSPGELSGVLTGSGFGARWLASLATLLLLAPVVLGLRALGRGGRPVSVWRAGIRTRGLVLMAAALLATEAGVLAISGHSGSDSSPTATSIALRALHLVTVGAWAGGLPAVLVALRSLRRDPGASAWSLLLPFSRFAAVTFVAAVLTGLLMASDQVASLTALLSTTYGAILVAKVIAVAAIAALALRHHRLIRRALRGASAVPAPRWPRTIRLEALLALAVLLLAAALASTAPARGPEFEASTPPASPPIRSTQAQDLVVRASLEPNLPGRNLLAVDVVNTRRPAPAAIDGVTVTLRRPAGADQVLPTGAPTGSRYEVGAVDLGAGDLEVQVTVLRAGLTPISVSLPWVVNTLPVRQHPTVVSSASLRPPLAALVLVIAALAAMWLARPAFWRVG